MHSRMVSCSARRPLGLPARGSALVRRACGALVEVVMLKISIGRRANPSPAQRYDDSEAAHPTRTNIRCCFDQSAAIDSTTGSGDPESRDSDVQ